MPDLKYANLPLGERTVARSRDEDYQADLLRLFGAEVEQGKVNTRDLTRIIEEFRDKINEEPAVQVGKYFLPPKGKEVTHALPPDIWGVVYKLADGQRLLQLRPHRHVAPADPRQGYKRGAVGEFTALDMWNLYRSEGQDFAIQQQLGGGGGDERPSKPYWDRAMVHNLIENPLNIIGENARSERVRKTALIFRNPQQQQGQGQGQGQRQGLGQSRDRDAGIYFSPKADILYMDYVYLREFYRVKIQDYRESRVTPLPLVPHLSAAECARVENLAIDAESVLRDRKAKYIANLIASALPNLRNLLLIYSAVVERPYAVHGASTACARMIDECERDGAGGRDIEAILSGRRAELPAKTVARLQDAFQSVHQKGSMVGAQAPQMRAKLICYYADSLPKAKVKENPTLYISDDSDNDEKVVG